MRTLPTAILDFTASWYNLTAYVLDFTVVVHFYLILLAVYTYIAGTAVRYRQAAELHSPVRAAVLLLRGIYANFTYFDVFWCPFSVADQLNHRHMATMLLSVQRRF